MTLKELTCEEIRSKIVKMDSREAKEFFDRLSPETQRRYSDYVVQRTREYLAHLIED